MLPVLVFMNLYVAHDYYLVAVSPAVAALVGLGPARCGRSRGCRAAALARRGRASVALAFVWGTVELKADYWARIDGTANDPIVMPLAGEIAARTTAHDPVAVVGLDWSPAVLYYAHRRGHMVTDRTKDLAFDLIHRDGYRHLAVRDPVLDYFSRSSAAGGGSLRRDRTWTASRTRLPQPPPAAVVATVWTASCPLGSRRPRRFAGHRRRLSAGGARASRPDGVGRGSV